MESLPSICAHNVMELLRQWFHDAKRLFPWRQEPSPYAVLVSEMMLQQTQASRVISFFEKWMARFPTIEKLAEASLDCVYKEWEGLGYYSRARALHQIAKTVVADWGGIIPNSPDALASLKGIGPYTVNALSAFAFHHNVAAVDANVVRVITRLFAIKEDIAKQTTKKMVQELANGLIPEVRGFEIAEAFIELGAVLCTQRRPQCGKCPLQGSCQSYTLNQVDVIPVKKNTIQYEKLFRDVAIIMADGHVLLRRQAAGNIMEGLYEFPYFESEPVGLMPHLAESRIEDAFSLQAQFLEALPSVRQSFTRFRALLHPKLFRSKMKTVDGHEWHHVEYAKTLAFSSGHKRVLELISRSLRYL